MKRPLLALALVLCASLASAGTRERLEELLARGEALESDQLRRHDLAIPVFRDAVDLAANSDDARLAARAWIGLGRSLGGVHRYREADEALLRGMRHAVLARDPHLQQQSLGSRATFAMEQGNTAAAEALFSEVVTLGETSGDPGLRARGLNGLSAVARRAGRPEEAIELAMEAMRAVDTAPPGSVIHPRLRFQIPYNLGSALGEAGDYGAALSFLERAGEAAEASGMLAGIWHVTHDSAMWYQALGDLPRAIRYYERALEVADQAAPRDMRAITLRHLAGAEGEAGRFERAVAHFEEALDLFERHQMREGIPETLVGLARFLRETGDRDRARELLAVALEEAARQDDAAMIVSARLVRGRILIDDGELERAREDFEEAIRIAVANGLRPLVPAGIEGLARIDEARGELERARDGYEESARLIESMRQAIPSHEQRVAFASATHDTFGGLVGVLVALHERGDAGRGDEALLAAERGRSQNLRAAFGRPEPRAAAERAADQARLATLQRRLATAETAAARVALDRQIDDAERKLHAARVESAIGAPPASIAALRKTLRDEEAFIAYASAGAGIVAFVVGPHSSRVIPLGVIPDLETRVAFFTALLGRAAPGEAVATGRRLAREILAPVLPALEPGTRRLIFSASGALAGVPFAALPHPAREGEPLVASYEVAFAGSLTELALIRARPRSGRAERLLAVGFSPTNRSTPVAVAGAQRSLSAIPFGEPEAREIARRFGSATVLTGERATERALAALPLDSYGVIHFASHAVLDSDTPSRSGVVLASAGEAGDGVLRGREILGWRLDGPLVVLSSCETAIGRASAAEGMQSLARAFQLAGARAVVGTMWPVEDRVSRRFARELYDGLATGATVGEAMRRAQRNLARDEPYASARHWAAFSVLGDPSLTLALPPRSFAIMPFVAPLLGFLLAAGVMALVKFSRP